MRNIQPSSMAVEDSLANYEKRLNKEIYKDRIKQSNPVYYVFHSEKNNLQKYYAEYNANTRPCKLEQLKSHYVDKDKRSALYDMYNRRRNYMQNEWNLVAKKNGELLLCPICGMKPVTDWDHYIPRSVMPEYSMHLQNLIPTCGDCNENKRSEWLKDGRRIYFNAYYDEAPDLTEILDVSVSIVNGLPSIFISLKKLTDKAPENQRIANSTISNMKLIDLYWQAKIDGIVRTFVVQCTSRVNVRRRKNENICIADIWKEEKEVVEDVIRNLTESEFIEKLVYQNIINSDKFEKWFITL